MFNTIVWATDGSETADQALPFALALAEREQATLVVAHVRELLSGRTGGLPVFADEDELLYKIEVQVEELRESGVAATLQLATSTSSSPAHLVAQIADDAGADVIVVGTCGRRPFAGAFLGSVTQHLLHDAHCPVLAVPPLLTEKADEPERELVEVAR
jgi:nucleotide-binding universal stress UspA family protein